MGQGSFAETCNVRGTAPGGSGPLGPDLQDQEGSSPSAALTYFERWHLEQMQNPEYAEAYLRALLEWEIDEIEDSRG